MTIDHTATPATGNLADSASLTAPKGGPMTAPAAAAAAAAEPEPVLLSPDAIDPDHWPNPRGPIDKTSAKYRELQGSIAAQGILQPVVVGPPILKGGRRPLIAGWRRYTAASEAQLEHIPVRERADITTEHQALQAALAENMAREDMTPLAEAKSIKRLMDLGDTQAEAARIVGVSERTARERLRLLTLPAAVRNAIDAGTIPTTAGRQLQVIADVSPKGASALAKRITAGKLRAGALLDPQLTRQALTDVRKDSGLVALQGSIKIAQLPLPAPALKALKARARKAAEYTYDAEWIDLSPTAVGKKLMQEAAEAGKVLTIGEGTGTTTYLADPAWIERAVSAALDRAEKRAADRKAQLARDRAKQDKRAEQDPAERARLQREREQADQDARAQPFAAAMNAELGDRLRALRSCAIEGAVARLLLHLTLDHHYFGYIARHGFALVDPEHRYATCPEAQTHTMVDVDVEGADTPQAAAAILVAVHVAFLYADPRGRDGKDTLHRDYIKDATKPLIRAAAQELGVLPERAERLDEARRTHTNQLAYHRGESDRRRILHELTKAARKGLQRDALYERCKVHSNEAYKLGASVQIWQHQQLDEALEQLKIAALVTIDESEGGEGIVHHHYRVTPAGRAALRAPVPNAPLFPVIDALPDAAAQDDPAVVIVHVTPSGGGDLVEAELQPERQAGRPNVRKVIYTESRTAAWVAVKRIVDLPTDDATGDDAAADATPAPTGTRREQALAHIAAQPGITIPELAERMQVKQNYLHRLLPGLDGIRKDGRGWFPAAAPADDADAASDVDAAAAA